MAKRLNKTTVDLGEIISPSTLDWAGHASMVIFLNGCNLSCPYCSNHRLLTGYNPVPIREVYKKIDDNRNAVDSVVLSGGEAICQFISTQLIARYARGFDLYNGSLQVGLHTNGYDSVAIGLLADQGYVNAMMLDIKPCNIVPPDYWEEVKLSMKYMNDARYNTENLDYIEARLTIFNLVNNDEKFVEAYSQLIQRNMQPDRLYIQQGDWSLSDNEKNKDTSLVTGERLAELARVALKNVGESTKVYVRARSLGEVQIVE